MKSPFFSIIVPVYNSEKYLSGAIESIIAQSFKKWELLLIDDGSTDSSGAICDKYSLLDSRIKTKHVENGGMCRARNIGLGAARGIYVTFCDNDDRYLPGLLENVYKFISDSNFDIDCVCYGRYLRQYSDNGTLLLESEVVPKVKVVYYGNDIYKNYDKVSAASDGVWSRCYKKQFLADNALSFDESLRHGAEDILFNAQVISHAKSIGLIPHSYYEWLRREGHSTSMGISPDTLDGIDRALSIEVDYLCKSGFNISNPKAFSRRVVSQMAFQIVNVRRKKNKSFKIEKSLYMMLRQIYLKFDKYINKNQLSIVHHVEYNLLMEEHYLLLFLFVLLSGVPAQIVSVD